MKKLCMALLLTWLTLLSGCNGTSGENETAVDPTPVITGISLNILNVAGESQQSFGKTEQVILQARVIDQFEQPISGQRVNFSVDNGSLSAGSILTDSNGYAVVSVSNEALMVGAVTAQASILTFSASRDFQFIDELDSDPIVASISLMVLNDAGLAQQSFDKKAQITLKAHVTDQFGQVMGGQIVNFSVNIGTLSVTAKLTNNDGDAIVTLNNAEYVIGAATAQASIATVSGSKNYEYIDNGAVELLPTLATSISLNGLSVSQFKTDQPVQLIARLTDTLGQPLSNHIIIFTADIGTLTTTTALTSDNGVASVTLSGDGLIGAGIITATLTDNQQVSSRINYEVVSASAIINSEVKLGYFDDKDIFVEGVIALSAENNTVSAGGTLGIKVDVVDHENKRINTPIPVNFTSNCVQNGHAMIDETVFSINGSAQATFEDIDCAGINGTDDVLIASVTVNGLTNTAMQTFSITGEQLGSIEFISAEPSSIVLKGTGGQGQQETSTLTFKVKSELGNALAQQQVSFALDTSVGGIILSRQNGLTNSQGLITTQVTAGTVPTAVRVTAKSTMTVNGKDVAVQTQSDLLSINTGLPEQRSLTIAASILNPEADFNGETSLITAWLADNFNNPVPDGTTVNFTTEGGVIEPTCSTSNGTCSVTWTSAEPRLPDHRSTILVTALGHESFFDTNGNNTFDDSDGSAIVDAGVSSGFSRHNAESSGFIDMSEAWRDDNENKSHDSGELFLDYNNSGSFSSQDGKFNGPQCQGSLCAVASSQAIHVRKALVLIMSGSTPDYILTNTNTGVVYVNSTGTNASLPDVVDGGSLSLSFSFSDSVQQTLPVGTTITASLSGGELAGQVAATVANNNAAGYGKISFVITNPIESDMEVATLTLTITTPKGIVTTLVKTVTLLGP